MCQSTHSHETGVALRRASIDHNTTAPDHVSPRTRLVDPQETGVVKGGRGPLIWPLLLFGRVYRSRAEGSADTTVGTFCALTRAQWREHPVFKGLKAYVYVAAGLKLRVEQKTGPFIFSLSQRKHVTLAPPLRGNADESWSDTQQQGWRISSESYG